MEKSEAPFGESSTYAQIIIGDFIERFVVPLIFWSKKDYIQQWVAAIEKLLNSDDNKNVSVALLTTMYDPKMANFYACWFLYREGSVVYVQNSMMILENLPEAFKLENIHSYVPAREMITDEGDKISEWATSTRELGEFLNKVGD